MPKMTAAKAVVEVMAREGVEKVFCVPGESYLSVLNELYEHPQIRLIAGRHEGGVSFMAEGYAKSSGKVGVCLATRGPGATNLSIGLHTAHQDSTPVVALIGQVERGIRGREGFQEVDLAEAFSHIVKWTVELNDPSRVPELLHRAFHLARSGRPGPVLVSLPEDVLNEVAEIRFQETQVFTSPRPEREAVNQVLELLTTSDRPVIIAGGGVTRTRSAAELTELAEKLKIPVAVSFRRFDAFPNHHPNYVGHLGIGAAKYLTDLIFHADVVLAIGTRFSQITAQDYTLLSPDTKLIHVDISADELNKVYRPALGIVADAKQFLLDLLSEVEGGVVLPENRAGYLESARKKYESFSAPKPAYDEEYVNLEGVMYDLLNVLPQDTIICNDAGNFFGWLSKYYCFREEGTYLGPTSGAMGYGLPAAIGAKLAHPDQTVIAFSGDGGFMMTLQEIETAVRNQIPILAIVANNNMYGTIRMHQEIHFPYRVIGTELTNPDFAELARTMGAFGERVESNKDFLPALHRALESKKPAVIELKTNPRQVTVSKTIDELRGGVRE